MGGTPTTNHEARCEGESAAGFFFICSVHIISSLPMKKLFPLIFLFLLPISICAQRPFFTDDADVADHGKFHVELGNQLSSLQRTSFPARMQNGFDALLAFGIFRNAEISFDAPFLTLINHRNNPPPHTSGIGDSTFSFKYNFHKEAEKSAVPALSATFSVQFPTGDENRSLGSGVCDYAFNFIAQKTIAGKNTLRVNAGMILAGNTLDGALGFKAHGVIFSGGVSFVREFTKKLQLGAEITGAAPSNFQLNAGQLQFQIGGNYQISKHQTFDFGLINGRFAASPHYALQLGTSIDF